MGIKQVAQLWQGDRSKLDAFSINVHRYSQNTSSVIHKIMHKIGFFGHPMGASEAIYALYLKFSIQ